MPHWASGRKRLTTGRRARAVLALGVLAGLAALMSAASVSAAALTSDTKQQCLPKLLQPPRVTKAEMIKPGRTLEVFVKAAYNGVKGCDAWERLGKYKVQIKQAGHWTDLEGNFWYPVDFNADPKNTAHEIAFLAFATHGIYEECVNGHWQPARVLFRNSVRRPGTKEIVAQGKVKSHPIKIEPTTAC